MMKKVVIIMCAALILVTGTSTYAASKARTLRELRAELASWKKEQAANESKKTATKNEISSAKASVSSKQTEISNNQQKIASSLAESEQLGKDIENGKTELEKIVKNYQVSKGDNVYLEYIFKATSYEDLIYRYAVMEQLMDYQKNNTDEWKGKIEYNTQLKIDLENREVELSNQIDSLANDIKSLNNKLSDYLDVTMDIKDEIASTQELINYYEKIGCKEDEDLEKCVSVKGDTGFLRPLNRGTTTSYFGYRTHPVTGVKNKFHSGIDIGGNKEGTNVYSVANGMVSKIVRKASCGGNQVYIQHLINGKQYTSCYMHLLTIKVSVGDKVTNQTIVGTVGGGSGTPWDSCSTGAHLHFGLGTGWYGTTYTSYSKWVANLVDPKGYLKFPNLRKYFYTRAL